METVGVAIDGNFAHFMRIFSAQASSAYSGTVTARSVEVSVVIWIHQQTDIHNIYVVKKFIGRCGAAHNLRRVTAGGGRRQGEAKLGEMKQNGVGWCGVV